MPAALDRLMRRLDPDPEPTPEPLAYHNPNQQPPPDPHCICRTLDSVGQNPTCDTHGWWTRDDQVLHLADLTRELGSSLAAAQAKFGGSA
jgi:hypothetical protein